MIKELVLWSFISTAFNYVTLLEYAPPYCIRVTYLKTLIFKVFIFCNNNILVIIYLQYKYKLTIGVWFYEKQNAISIPDFLRSGDYDKEGSQTPSTNFHIIQRRWNVDVWKNYRTFFAFCMDKRFTKRVLQRTWQIKKGSLFPGKNF